MVMSGGFGKGNVGVNPVPQSMVSRDLVLKPNQLPSP